MRGKTALILGASSAMGRSTACMLAAKGVRLVLHGRVPERLAETAGCVAAQGEPAAATILADMLDPAALTGVFPRAHAVLGTVDYLINCIGARGTPAPFEELTYAEIRDMMAVNFTGPAHVIQDAAKHMVQRQSGHIIGILTSACLFPLPTYAAYTAAKSALESLLLVLAKEVRGRHVKVTRLYPGSTLDPESRLATELDSTDGPFLGPDDIAHAVADCLGQPAHVVTQSLVLRPMADINY